MADHHASSAHSQRATRATTTSATFLRKLQDHAPNSTHLAGLLTLLITAATFLFSGTILGLIFLTPLIIVSSPIWIPATTVLFLVTAGFLCMCGLGVAVVAAFSWMYRYLRGLHPPGSDRIDYARSRIFDTASHVKDYAWEYGGYLQSKVKDAAPGA